MSKEQELKEGVVAATEALVAAILAANEGGGYILGWSLTGPEHITPSN